MFTYRLDFFCSNLNPQQLRRMEYVRIIVECEHHPTPTQETAINLEWKWQLFLLSIVCNSGLGGKKGMKIFCFIWVHVY